MAVARSLGYVPRGTAPVRQREFEVILNDHDRVNAESWLNVNRGAQREAARLGYVLRMRLVHDARQVADVAPGTAGVLVAGHTSSEVVTRIGRLGLPAVYVGGMMHGGEVGDHVRTGDEEGMELLADLLLGLGHRSVLFAHGEGGRIGRVMRCAHLRAAMARQSGTAFAEITFPDTEQSGFVAALLEILAAGTRPTAIVCGNDVVGVTVVGALQRLGLSVPDDVSVIGFADYAAAQQVEPKLTTIRIPSEDMGVQAVRLLAERCECGADIAPKRIQIVPRLIVRGSTAAAGAPRWDAVLADMVARA